MAISFKDWKGVGSFGTIGLEIVVSILGGLLGGRWLDGKFGTSPYLALFGFFFGLAAATRAVIRAWRDMQREAAREEREQGNPAPLYDTLDDKRASRRDEPEPPLPPPPPSSPDDNP